MGLIQSHEPIKSRAFSLAGCGRGSPKDWKHEKDVRRAVAVKGGAPCDEECTQPPGAESSFYFFI